MSLGLDYAFARPGGAQLKAHGVVGVGRYLVSDSRGLTAAEVADYKANGVGLWVVYEGNATGMLNGKAQGVTDAHSALTQAAKLGLPSDVVIYWAADFDIAPGSADIAKADAYVAGWNSVIPEGRRGGYGGLWYLQHVGGSIDHRWECASTSFRHGVDPASVDLDLQQTVQAPPLADTDYNNVFKTGSFVGQTSTTISTAPTGSGQPMGVAMAQNYPFMFRANTNDVITVALSNTQQFNVSSADHANSDSWGGLTALFGQPQDVGPTAAASLRAALK